jgi:hypothetical protein
MKIFKQLRGIISKLKEDGFSNFIRKFPRCIDYITLTLFTIFVQYPYFTNKIYAFRDLPFFFENAFWIGGA